MVADNQQGDNRDAQKRQEILQTLLNDPYFQGVAKRVRKQTTAVPKSWRNTRKMTAEMKVAGEGHDISQPTAEDTSGSIARTSMPAEKSNKTAAIALPTAMPSPVTSKPQETKRILPAPSASAPQPTQDPRSITRKPVTQRITKPSGTRKVIIQQIADGQSLDAIVDQLSQTPSQPEESEKITDTKPIAPTAIPVTGVKHPSVSQIPSVPKQSEPDEEYMDISDRMEQSMYLAIPDEKNAAQAKPQMARPPTKPFPLRADNTASPANKREQVAAASAGTAPTRRQIVVAQGSLEATLAGLDGQSAQKSAPGQEDDVSWMVNTISNKMDDASAELLNNLVDSLQQGSAQAAATDVAQDIQQYAQQIGVAAKDLYNAMHEEGIESLEQLAQAFQEMATPGSGVHAPNFEIFVSGLVHSYRDRKNEVALLGLIGVNPTTGKQHLSTTYARLLAEIFRPEIGGFFLQDTKNPNYNCFNLGNVIQHRLLELDEMARVSYLENLLTLLKERNQLVVIARNMIDATIKDAYFIKLFSDQDKIFSLLERYFADLAIFQLGLIGHEDLPDDITQASPHDIYQCLHFVAGFPKNLIQKNSKVIYMLQRLYENDPMLFHVV
jgi:hypothetical protein